MGDIKIDRAVIEVQGACNFDCSMCPQDKREGGRHKDFLTKMSLLEFETYVADCKKHGLRVVNLDGSGEATINRNLPEYIKIVKKYDASSFSLTDLKCMVSSCVTVLMQALTFTDSHSLDQTNRITLVSYPPLRAPETKATLVCRLLL